MARFATFTVGIAVIVLPDGAEAVHVAHGAGEQRHRRARRRQARRMRISPSELCNDASSSAGSRSTSNGLLPSAPSTERVPRRHRARASAQAGRRAAGARRIHRPLGDEVGRAAEDPHGQPDQLQSDAQVSRLVPRPAEAERADSTRSYASCCANRWNFENPATNYYQLETNTLKLTEDVAQVFMGMRVQCAQCHNHPFDRWTMDDYYGFAAFFAQVGLKQARRSASTSFSTGRRGGEPPGRPARWCRRSSSAARCRITR